MHGWHSLNFLCYIKRLPRLLSNESRAGDPICFICNLSSSQATSFQSTPLTIIWTPYWKPLTRGDSIYVLHIIFQMQCVSCMIPLRLHSQWPCSVWRKQVCFFFFLDGRAVKRAGHALLGYFFPHIVGLTLGTEVFIRVWCICLTESNKFTFDFLF